jgi:hypothetical protein
VIFALEQAREPRIRALAGLERQRAAAGSITRAIDRAHATATELFEDAVTTGDQCARAILDLSGRH